MNVASQRRRDKKNGVFLEARPEGKWYVYQYRENCLDWIFSFDAKDKALSLFDFSKQRMLHVQNQN